MGFSCALVSHHAALTGIVRAKGGEVQAGGVAMGFADLFAVLCECHDDVLEGFTEGEAQTDSDPPQDHEEDLSSIP
jgi:hypothetical protein